MFVLIVFHVKVKGAFSCCETHVIKVGVSESSYKLGVILEPKKMADFFHGFSWDEKKHTL